MPIRDVEKAEKDGYVIETEKFKDDEYLAFKTFIGGKYYSFSFESVPEEIQEDLAEIVTHHFQKVYAQGRADREKEIADRWKQYVHKIGEVAEDAQKAYAKGRADKEKEMDEGWKDFMKITGNSENLK